MASGYAPKWRRFLHRHARWLFKKCPGGNYHWRWDAVCYCMLNEYCGEQGGLYVFETGKWYEPREPVLNGVSFKQKIRDKIWSL